MTNEEIIKELSGKTVLEINELVKALEEAWGVSAAAAVAVAGPAAAAAPVVKPPFNSFTKIPPQKFSPPSISKIKIAVNFLLQET